MSNLFRIVRSVCLPVKNLQISQSATFFVTKNVAFDKEIKSVNFTSVDKKFFFDVKQGEKDRYIKISEISRVSVTFKAIYLYCFKSDNLFISRRYRKGLFI